MIARRFFTSSDRRAQSVGYCTVNTLVESDLGCLWCLDVLGACLKRVLHSIARETLETIPLCAACPRIIGNPAESQPAGKILREKFRDCFIRKTEIGEAFAIRFADELVCPLDKTLPLLETPERELLC
jgi:hypothetical protein